jgi:hypothetical protein
MANMDLRRKRQQHRRSNRRMKTGTPMANRMSSKRKTSPVVSEREI